MDENKKIKITISGDIGVGKTTLALVLEEFLFSKGAYVTVKELNKERKPLPKKILDILEMARNSFIREHGSGKDISFKRKDIDIEVIND